jgi:zinc transport system permease protein
MGTPTEYSPAMIIELIRDPLFQHAIIAAILSGVACGVIGVFVVVKRISNITGSIAHSAFGGIGLAVYLGYPPLAGALIVGWLSGLIMAFVRHRFKQNEDTLIGLIWVVGMTIGLLALHFSTGYTSDLFGMLFGNLLLVSPADLMALLVWDVILLTTVIGVFRLLHAVVFDELFATVTNLPVRRVNYGLISAVSISTILLIKSVGIILVIALITLPAATALNISTRFGRSIVVSVVMAIMATVMGTSVSFGIDIPAAPAIVIVLLIQYCLSVGYSRLYLAR